MNKNSLPLAIAASTVLLSTGSGLLSTQATAAALEEIVVTATRREESLQEVPLAVSALTADQLTKGGIFETTDLNRSSPNLQVSSAYGEAQPNFSIRGVGVGTEYNANAASPVGVYVDQVYQTFRPSHGQQLYDMEQIEVVRGPQGTLYGRNTTGGAVNFITRKPQLAETNGNLTIGYGNYSRKNMQGAVEFTPVADKFGVRVAGTWVEADPYVENKLAAGNNTFVAGGASGLNRNSGKDPGGYENYGLRATFRFVPSDNVDLMLKVYKGENDGGTEVPIATGQSKSNDVIDYTNSNYLLAPYVQMINGLAPGLIPEQYSQSARGLDIREVETNSVGQMLIKTEGVVFTADVTLNDNLSLIAITGYDSGEYHQDPTTDCDATPLSACTIGYNSDFDAYNIDVRLDYQNGPLKLIAGAFYGSDSITNDNKPNFFNFTRDVNAALGVSTSYWNPGGLILSGNGLPADLPTGITGLQHNQQDRDSWAIYGEANYELTEDLNLTVGLRYSDDTLEYSEGLSTFYDDAGTARALFVSDFVNPLSGGFAPYFLEDLYDSAGNLVAPASALNGGAPMPNPLQLEGGSDSISGRIILDWHVTDGTMLYASYSRGYRAGTMNGLSYASANQVYFVPEEEVDAYEAGFKSRLMDDRLQLNGSLFYYDYVGQQGQIVDNTATAFLVSLDGEITGAELDAKFAATDNLTLTAALGWLDSEYEDGECPTGGITGFQQGNCVASSAGPANVGGNPFPYAAELTFNAGFDWDIAEFGDGLLALHGDAAYTGQFYYDAFEKYSDGVLPNISTGKYSEGEGEYWTFNARLSYSTEKYSMAIWGKNLGDKEYYPFGISIENLFSNGYRMIAPPRTYGAEIQFFF
ncbi:MAG: TonB-dependent receptor [Gammaproteobacteria bacterium]|nr:TonB-dependent receptor [Gammaproteobacteria bacterium]